MHTILALLLASTAFVPKTDFDTLAASPLAEGEVAHTVSGGKARLWVGGKDGALLPVVDGSALRGEKIVTLGRGEYSVVYDAGITYTASNDTWSALNGSLGIHRIVITCSSLVTIESLEFDSRIDTTGDITCDEIGTIEKSISGNVAVITMTKLAEPTESGRHFEVSNIAVKRVEEGGTDAVTDLDTHIFRLHDSLGSFTFGGLRPWAAHLYDGNRGEDWAAYTAKATAHMGGETLTFDERKRYSFVCDAEATNITFTAAGMPVWSVYASGTGSGYEDCFTFSGIVFTNGCVELYYTEDIDNFDLAALAVQTNSVLTTNGWVTLPSSAYAVKTNGYIRLAGSYEGTAFYRLNYAGMITTNLTLTVSAPTDFTGGLTANGAAVLTTGSTYLTDADKSGSTLRIYKSSGETIVFTGGGGGGASLEGYTADFNGGTNFTYHLYAVLTNVVLRLGGSITNYPAFAQ